MSKLFSPLQVKNLNFANRIVLPPMAGDRAEPDGTISDGLIAYYREMAGCGMGLLIIEHNFIDPDGKVSARQISISRDEDIAGHHRLLAGLPLPRPPVALQINHSGSQRVAPFNQGLGASPIPHPVSGITPKEMTKKDITDVVRAFGQAGRRAKAAGYDLVEIHCAHGYLLSQFLSPLTNQRRDKYGGTLLKRMLLPLEVLEEVRSQVGEDFPVMVRLGLADNPPAKTLYPGGLPVEEGLVAARALEQAGSAILDLSAGICGSRPAGVSGEAYYLPFAQACSQAVKLPLICTGGVTLAQTAEHIVASGTAALVGVGRALAADRSWVEKARKELT